MKKKTIAILLMIIIAAESICPEYRFPVQAAENVEYIFPAYDGEKTVNFHAHEYDGDYGTEVRSYLQEISQGIFQRVEAVKNTIYVEKYDQNYQLLSTKKIDGELEFFCGYYAGENSNFVVYGQDNPQENDNVEVIRLVKYDKNWNRLSQSSVFGANTKSPMGFGSLRMEENGNMLAIHTCHTMYKTSDGLNHQANMSFIVNTDTMEMIKKCYTIGYDRLYTSHSFDQYVLADQDGFYYVDLGDGGPRAIVLNKVSSKAAISGSSQNIQNVFGSFLYSNTTDNYRRKLLLIRGELGDNYTGVNIGDFQFGEGENLLITGNSIDQTQEATDKTRNVFLINTSKEKGKDDVRIQWITHYNSSSDRTVSNPYLVKKSEDVYYLLWNETFKKDNTSILKLLKIDGQGNPLSGVQQICAPLSDCHPIINSNGKLMWYMTFGYYKDGSSDKANGDGQTCPVFYEFDPDNVDSYGRKECINIDQCDFSDVKGTYRFDGKKLLDIPKIFYNGYQLKPFVDYIPVEYIDNAVEEKYNKSGKISIKKGKNLKIQGINAFYGSKEKVAEIDNLSAVDIKKCELTGLKKCYPMDVDLEKESFLGYQGEMLDKNDYKIISGWYTPLKSLGVQVHRGDVLAGKGRFKGFRKIKYYCTKFCTPKKMKLKVNKYTSYDNLMWKSQKYILGYELQIAKKKNMKQTAKRNINMEKTTFTVRPKKYGAKKVYVRIRAYQYQYDKKVCGKWSGVKVVK